MVPFFRATKFNATPCATEFRYLASVPSHDMQSGKAGCRPVRAGWLLMFIVHGFRRMRLARLGSRLPSWLAASAPGQHE